MHGIHNHSNYCHGKLCVCFVHLRPFEHQEIRYLVLFYIIFDEDFKWKWKETTNDRTKIGHSIDIDFACTQHRSFSIGIDQLRAESIIKLLCLIRLARFRLPMFWCIIPHHVHAILRNLCIFPLAKRVLSHLSNRLGYWHLVASSQSMC